MKDPIEFYRKIESGELNFWEATCKTLETWFDMEFKPNQKESQTIIQKAEAFLEYELPDSAKELVRLMANLKESDPAHIALDLKPQYSEIETQSGDFLCLFNITDEDDIRYGFKKWTETSSEYNQPEYREHIYCIDFDRDEGDLNEDDPEDSVEDPDVELFSLSPEAFVLNLLKGRYVDFSSTPLYLAGEVDDDEDDNLAQIEESIDNQFGRKISIKGWDMWSEAGIWIIKYYWSGLQLEMITHNKSAAEKTPEAVFTSIGLTKKEVDRHDF